MECCKLQINSIILNIRVAENFLYFYYVEICPFEKDQVGKKI